jgi:putative glutamine amidotransferase
VSHATPNIGLTCNLEVVVYGGGQWTEPAAMVPLTYVQAVARAGARPLLIAPTPADEADPAELFGLLDGVLVTGGADVDPAAYGAVPHPATIHVTAERDAFELLLVREATARDVPCLGICRGMQMLNVAYGGTLEQHLPERLGDDIHSAGGDGYAEHVVELEPGTLAAGASGAPRCSVKSAHHQGIDRLADGLRVSGRAADGTIEALEDPARSFVLGVLWHPEEDAADRLIGAFVRACRARAGGPALGTAGAAGLSR